MPTHVFIFKEEELRDMLSGGINTLESDGKKYEFRMENDLWCPKCGRDSIMNIKMLTSLPPQYEYDCICGYRLSFSDRENSSISITQSELDKYFLKGN